MKILRIKSLHPNTEYTPSWNYPVGIDQWNDEKSVDTIKNWLIANEQDFIDRYPVYHDGGTGLGLDSVTGRHGQYNLFEYIKHLPELDDLLNVLRFKYLEFVSKEQGNWRDLDIYAWFNIMRNGQKIEEHGHGADERSYLSGNMHLDTYNTLNTYRSPFDPSSQVIVGNTKGDIAFFPSCVPHYSDEYIGTEPRVSIAFDLRLATDPFSSKLRNIEFMNTEIFQTIVEAMK
jgi:hypothetical protein